MSKTLKLRWTGPALDDLRSIRDYVSRDDPVAAKRLAKRLRSSVVRLRRFPKSGRIVPELSSREFREVIVGSYRIVYNIQEEAVVILRIWHSRQELGGD
jgi:addiction module RelE/StbE family toxin